MKRRLLCLFGSFLLTSVLPGIAAEKPNVIFILADDLGWSDTTLYGETKLYETPNLERLAARGMTFTRAYTANPLCSPTRSSILTGLHPARTGLTAPKCHLPEVVLEATAAESAAPDRKLTAYDAVTRLDPKYETLAERFLGAGYATAHFGKWHLGSEPYSPLEHGFEVDIPHWHGPGPAGSFVAPWKFPDFKEKTPGEHIEDRMGDEAVAFMEAQGDRPFFLNYWQFSVHAPFDAKPDLIEKYRGKIDPEDAQRSPTYAAMVQSLDENVGKMLDAVDRLGIADRTIFVFFSDNGGNMYNEVDGTTPTSNRPLRGGKGNNWDGGVRVPAVICWPDRVEGGSRSDTLITSTDFYPTLLEMVGLAPAEEVELDGVSLVPVLEGGDLERNGIFTFFPHSTRVPDTLPPSAACYQGKWKLLRLLHHGEGGAHVHRLFDLEADPGERNDLSATESERVAEMASRLDEFLTATGAVYPRANPNYDPSRGQLSEIGWRAVKDGRFADREDHLELNCLATNAHVNVGLKEPVAKGALVLRVRLESDRPGRIDLRWAEKGVKPLYFKDRLVRSEPFPADRPVTVEIPFEAAGAVTSFRVDLLRPPGKVKIRDLEIRRGEASEVAWDFTKE